MSPFVWINEGILRHLSQSKIWMHGLTYFLALFDWNNLGASWEKVKQISDRPIHFLLHVCSKFEIYCMHSSLYNSYFAQTLGFNWEDVGINCIYR